MIRGDPSFFESNKGKRGRKKKCNRTDLRKAPVKALPYEERRNFRGLMRNLGISESMVRKLSKEEGAFKRHSSALKPAMTEENKASRVWLGSWVQ